MDGDSNYNGVSQKRGTATIGKADGYLTLSSTSGSVIAGQTASISVSSHHGGTLSGSATGGDTGRVGSITASGSTISVPTNGVAAGSVTITVTCAATANYKEASVTYTLTINASFISMYDATDSDIGKVICSEGHIHTNVSGVTCGGTACAMIAYVGSEEIKAIALEDLSDNTMTWNQAVEQARSWNYPFDGDVWWGLPSVYHWQDMFKGCGSTSAYISDINNGDWEEGNADFEVRNFQSMLSNCGGTPCKDNVSYWTSTEHYLSDYQAAWFYIFYTNYGYGTFNATFKTGKCYGRACLFIYIED